MSLKEIWERIADAWTNGWAEISGMENKWKDEDPRVLLSVAVGILTAVACGVMTHKKIVTRRKQKQTAIETGKVIRAKCIQIYRDYDTDEDTGVRHVTYHGVYEYTVDGKVKRYRVHDGGGLPNTFLYLYYADSPKKVFSDYDNIQLGYNLAGLLGIAACLLTMYCTGYIL